MQDLVFKGEQKMNKASDPIDIFSGRNRECSEWTAVTVCRVEEILTKCDRDRQSKLLLPRNIRPKKWSGS